MRKIIQPKHSQQLVRFPVLAALVLLTAFAGVLPAIAQTNCAYTVTSASDNVPDTNAIPGTLRYGVQTTISGTICFSLPNPSTITLKQPLTMTNPVSISGPGLSALTVSGGGTVQPLILNLQNSASSPVLIEGLTISNGTATLGGGVWVQGGFVELFQIAVSGNNAQAGGGVYNEGTLTIQNTIVHGNQSTNGDGGGIFNLVGATLTLTGGKVDSNSSPAGGGGIANNGTMSVEGTAVYQNTGADGGGIYNDGQFTTTGTSSQIDSNTATDGGGIFNDASGVATLVGMSLNGNAVTGSSAEGGGISNGGILQMSECTFTANTSDDIGGAIYNVQTLTLINNTIAANSAAQSGGGVYNDITNSDNTINLHNDIISGNTANTSGVTVIDCQNCGGPSADNLIGVPVNLGPLAANGGIATTFMPLPGSPAIAGGVYSTNGVAIVTDATDERGLSRTTVSGNNVSVDVGAVQTHYSAVRFDIPPGSSQTANQAITPTVQVYVIETDGGLNNYPAGVPVTMQLQTQDSAGTPTLSGTLTQYPSTNPDGPVTAKFADLKIDVAGSYYLLATTYPSSLDGQMSTYSGTSGSFSVGPAQQTATVTWAPPSYAYGPLLQSELNATVSINGAAAVPCTTCTYSFNTAYDGASLSPGRVYAAGNYAVTATYTVPSGLEFSGSATLVVTKATPTVSVVTPSAIVPGIPLSKGMLLGTAIGLNGATLPGSYSYSPALGTVPASGSKSVTVTFTPADTTDYATTTTTATLTVLAPAATATTATITPATAYAGTAETLAVQVLPASGAPGVVSGTVSVTGLGTQPLLLLPDAANFSISGSPQAGSSYDHVTSYAVDMNADGVVDQVVINDQSPLVEVLFSDPARPGNYLGGAGLTTYAACDAVTGVAIGDVNGDGLPDLVASCRNSADQNSTAGPEVLFLNQGNGNFASPTTVGTMEAAQVALGDFDGDGKVDLVSVGSTGGSLIAFQQGNGDGTFNAASYTDIDGGQTSDTFSNLIAADFNKDGVPDLSFIYKAGGAAQGQVVVWLTNPGTTITFGIVSIKFCERSFCPSPNDPNHVFFSEGSGNAPASMAAADLNGDGLTDLAVITTDHSDGSGNTIFVALNLLGTNGDHSVFLGTTSNTASPGAQSLALADFDQDGTTDVVVYSDTTNTVSVRLGDGGGAFPTIWPHTIQLSTPVSYGGAAPLLPVFNVGDVNGDGFPDILLIQETAQQTATSQLIVTSGPTTAGYSTTAPAQSTTYKATAAPASKLWSASSGPTTLTIENSVVTLAWTPATLTYGPGGIPQSELNAIAMLGNQPYAGNYVYTFTATGAPINVGQVYPAATYGVQVAFTPTGSTQTYTLGTDLTIQQAATVLTIEVAPVLLPGEKLNTANVHAVATDATGALVAGTFSYSEALGSTPSAGQHTVTVGFTPTDTTDYLSAATQSASFEALAAEATTTTLLANPNPAVPGYSVVLSATVAPANGLAGAVPGTVAFSSASGALASSKLALDPAGANFIAGATSQFGGGFDYNTFSADFNGDGVADLLLVPNDYGPLQLMLSQPGNVPALGVPITLDLGSACSSGTSSGSVLSAAIGDANGDGLPDIAVVCANFDSTATYLVVLINQGGGVFIPSAGTGIPGDSIAEIVFGDFNGDGKQDLALLTDIAGNNQSVYLWYLPGNGTGNYVVVNSELVANGSPTDIYTNLVTGDFNHDGHLDLAFLHSTDSTAGAIEIWKFNPGTTPSFGSLVNEGEYQPDKTITAGSGGTLASLVSADFNQDGLPDLALVTYTSTSGQTDTTSVVLNTSSNDTLSFANTDTTSTAGPGSSLVAADFDGDGVPDLALYNSTDNTVKVLHGAGDGSFSSTEPNLNFTLSQPVFEPEARRPLTTRRRGARAAAHPLDSQVGPRAYPVLAVGDTNGDGYPDLLVAAPTYDSSYNTFVNGQQFVTSGPSVAKTVISPTASATYTAVATPAAPPYWSGSTGTTDLVLTLVPTMVQISNIAPDTATYGQPLTITAVVQAFGPGVIYATGGSVTFSVDGVTLSTVELGANGIATLSLSSPVIAAGQHQFAVSYSGTSVYAAGVSPAMPPYVIAKAKSTLTWATPVAISTTTPLSATQLDAAATGVANASLPGTYAYTPAPGTLLTQGSHTLSVTFTPTDTVDYNSASATVAIQVNNTNTRTTLSITPGSSTYGQALTLSATVVTVGGSTSVQGGTVTFTADGKTLSSVTVVNGAATLGAVLLTGGSHTIGASYSGIAGESPSAAGSQVIQIAKATPILTWAMPAAITTTTALSGTQLNATAVGLPGSTLNLPGTFVYDPAPGTTLSGGVHTLSVTFTPNDGTDYTTASTTVQIQVNATVTQTTLSVSAESSTYGQLLTLTAHVTNTAGTAVVSTGAVTFSANGAVFSSVAVSNGIATLSGVHLPVGQSVVVAAYSSTGSEAPSSATNTVTVAKATPTLTWATPVTISTTTPLSGVQLDATAAGAGTTGALSGNFTYTPAAGTTLSVGAHTLSVVFTPTDAVDYTTASATVQIQVQNSNTQTSFAVTPASSTYGQTLTLNAQVVNANGSGTVQSGSIIFATESATLATVAVVNGAASLSGVSLAAGQHLLTASYTGAPGEGTSAAAGQPVTVNKAVPVLTWPTPAQITTTTPLGGTQLNATAVGVGGAALPGSFTYTPAAGTLLIVGAHTLSVTFTPTDALDYSTATTQVQIQVVPETITLGAISPSTSTLSNSPLPVTLTGSGFPSSAVVQLNGITLPTTFISPTQLGATIPAARLGTAGTLSFTLYDAASNATSNVVPFSVTAPTPNVTVTAPTTTISGDQPTVALAIAQAYPVDLTGTFTLTFTPAGPNGIDDPAVQFSTGGRTLNFTIPAGTTTGPTVALQSGTVEGAIEITTVLTAGGANVTPPDIAPAAITIAAAPPTITGVTFTDVNGLLTVVVTGFSNTREMADANFVFTGPGVVDLAKPEVTVPAVNLFSGWYGSTGSADFGSTFTYTQSFQLSDPTTNLTGVSVTLTNTVGASTSVNSQ